MRERLALQTRSEWPVRYTAVHVGENNCNQRWALCRLLSVPLRPENNQVEVTRTSTEGAEPENDHADQSEAEHGSQEGRCWQGRACQEGQCRSQECTQGGQGGQERVW